MSRSRASCGLRYRHLKPKPRPSVKATEKRSKILQKMGFVSYRAYLRSPLWKAIRGAQLAETANCEICDTKATQVHHLDYSASTLAGKNPHKLVSICDSCHKKLEFREDGTKRNYESVAKKTKTLLKRRRMWHNHTKRGQTKPEQSDGSDC